MPRSLRSKLEVVADSGGMLLVPLRTASAACPVPQPASGDTALGAAFGKDALDAVAASSELSQIAMDAVRKAPTFKLNKTGKVRKMSKRSSMRGRLDEAVFGDKVAANGGGAACKSSTDAPMDIVNEVDTEPAAAAPAPPKRRQSSSTGRGRRTKSTDSAEPEAPMEVSADPPAPSVPKRRSSAASRGKRPMSSEAVNETAMEVEVETQPPAGAAAAAAAAPAPAPVRRQSSTSRGKRPMLSTGSAPRSPAKGPLRRRSSAAMPATVRSKKPVEKLEIAEDDDVLEHPRFAKLALVIERIAAAGDQQAVSVEDEEEGAVSPLVVEDALALQRELAELKPLGQLHRLPEITLGTLLDHLGNAVEIARRQGPSEDEDEPEFKLIRAGFLAAISALTLMTTERMPKRVFQEDLITSVVKLTTRTLDKTIFPAYDPELQDDLMSTGKRKPGSASKPPVVKISKAVARTYASVCEAFELFNELLPLTKLPDEVILELNEWSVQTFFRTGRLQELQHKALAVVRTNYSYSTEHRAIVLDEIMLSLQRTPASRRDTRTYRVHADESIRMISALVMHIAQSTVQLSVVHSGLTDEKLGAVRDHLLLAQKESDHVVTTVIDFLLAKCGKAGEDTDFKTVLTNLADDCLVVLNLPQWPAAEMLLRKLALKLLPLLKTEGSANSRVRQLALDLLGKIAAVVRGECVALNEVVADSAQGVALDVTLADDLPAEWQRSKATKEVDARMMGHLVTLHAETSNATPEERAEAISTLQDALLQYANANSEAEPLLTYARDFDAASFVTSDLKTHAADAASGSKDRALLEADREERCAQIAAELCRPTNRNTAVMSDIAAHAVRRGLAVLLPLMKGFPPMLQHILAALRFPESPLRMKALKSLSKIIEVDWTVLARADVKREVERMGKDRQISVRAEVVDLFGKFVLNQPDLTVSYYAMFKERLTDKGVSVRKAVVKVFQQILENQPDFDQVDDACGTLLLKVKDVEKGVADMVVTCFSRAWFTGPLAATQARDKRDGAKVRKDALESRVNTILRVIGTEEEGSLRVLKAFEEVVRHVLNPDSKNATALSLCGEMTALIVDKLCSPELDLQEKLSCLRVLDAFSSVHPTLLVNHAELLRPLLQPNTRGLDKKELRIERECIFNVAAMYARVIPTMSRRPSESFLNDVESACTTLMLTTPVHGLIEVCAKCLKACTDIDGNVDIALDTTQNFYQNLKRELEHQGSMVPWKQRKAGIYRSLFASGVLCRYFDFDYTPEDEAPPLRELDDDGDEDPELSEEVVPHVVYMALREFVDSFGDMDAKRRALMGLGHLFIKNPALMVRQDMLAVYRHWLSPDPADREAWRSGGGDQMRLQVLQNLNLFLDSETERLALTEEETERDLKEIGGKEDSGEIGVVVSSLQDEIRLLALEADFQIRNEAFQILRKVLQQGLVLPLQCITHLIALTTDPDPRLCAQALGQLTQVNEQYHDYVYQYAVDGVRIAFEFQRRLAKAKSAGQPYAVRGCKPTRDGAPPSPHLGSVYRMLQPKKVSRRAFLTGLAHLFDPSRFAKPGAKGASRKRGNQPSSQELAFIAEMLAEFPYETCEEPLFVIHCLLNVWTVQGMLVQPRFAELVGFSMAVDVKDDDNADEATVLEKLGGSLAEISPELLDVAAEAQALTLMLRLMAQLQDLYGFTDARCHLFTPAQAMKDNSQKVHRKDVGRLDVDSLRSPARNAKDIAKLYAALAQLDARDFTKDPEGDSDPAEGEAMAVDEGSAAPSPATPSRQKRRASAASSGQKSTKKGRRSSSSAKKPARKSSKKPKRKKKVDSDESEEEDDSDFDAYLD